MQQQFLLDEPEAEQRLIYLFPTTDGVTGKVSGVSGNNAWIAIGSAAFVTTISTAVQFTGPETYPLYYVQLFASELSVLGHGIVSYKDGDSVWFAGIFKVVASSSEVNLDAMKLAIDKNRSVLKDIQWKINRTERKTFTNPFVSPL